MSNLPVDPYDRTVIVETTIDNPDRAPLAGTGRDIVVSLWPEDKPGRKMAFLSASGEWVPFTTTEFTAWGSILGDITDQADLMAMFALYAPIADLAPVAFTGNYNDLTNKPVLGDLAFINTNGLSSYFLNGLGQWAIPTDVYATWGNITGNINAQADLMALLNAKAPINNPTFTGIVTVPTLPVDNNSAQAINSAWFFGQASNTNPLMDGVASSGAGLRWARGDHVHPSDITKASLAGPAPFTGTTTVPNVAYPNDSTLAANTHYVSQAIAAIPAPPATAWGSITGTLSNQTDLQTALNLKAPLASPVFTGDPRAPTPAAADNDTSIATTAFVTAAIAASGGVSPPPSDGNTYGYKNGAWVVLDLATKWDKA